MTSQITEQAFEANVESMLLDSGWAKGNPAEWDVDQALFPECALAVHEGQSPPTVGGYCWLFG